MGPSQDDPAVEVGRFDPHDLSESELADLTELHNAVHLETRPDDPPRPPHFARDHYLSLADSTGFERHFFLARWSGAVVGALTASRRLSGGNHRVLHIDLQVRPEARRRRVGSALLERAAATARAGGQDVVIGMVTGREPLADRPGGRFLSRFGGTTGLDHRIYRLELRDVDAAELRDWKLQGAARSPGIELSWRFDRFRDDELADIARLMQAMNGAPRGELKVEPTVHNADSVADRDRALFARGFERAVLLARQREGSQLVGYTMMLVDPYDPRLLRQADTAIEPRARGRGLGKWLKAAMLLHMMAEYPERTEVRTGTADANEAMLTINRRIGFRPWLAHSVWQVTVDALEEGLRGLEPRPAGTAAPLR